MHLNTTKFFTFESQYTPRQVYRLEYHTLYRLSINVENDRLINKIVGGYGGVVVDGKKSTLYCSFSSTYKHPYIRPTVVNYRYFELPIIPDKELTPYQVFCKEMDALNLPKIRDELKLKNLGRLLGFKMFNDVEKEFECVLCDRKFVKMPSKLR